MLKKWIYILPTFQNTTQIMETTHSLNDSKQRMNGIILQSMIAVKILPALWRRRNSKNNGAFSCLSCLHLFITKKIISSKKVCEEEDFWVL